MIRSHHPRAMLISLCAIILVGCGGTSVATKPTATPSATATPPPPPPLVFLLGGSSGSIYGTIIQARDAKTGTLAWSDTFPDLAPFLIGTSFPVYGQQLFLQSDSKSGSGSGHLVARALNALTGAVLWSVSVGSDQCDSFTNVGHNPSFATGTDVFFSADTTGAQGCQDPNPRLYDVESATGKLRWSADSNNGYPTGEAGGNIIITDNFGGILALNAQTGAASWKVIDNANGTTPILDGDAVINPLLTNVTVYSAATGQVLWTAPANNEVVADGATLVVVNGSAITAYNTLSGAQLWSVSSGDHLAAAGEGTVLVSDQAHDLIGLRESDGKILWTIPNAKLAQWQGEQPIFGSGAAQGTLYLFSNVTATLTAINLQTGDILWQKPVPHNEQLLGMAESGPGEIIIAFTG